MFFSLRGRFLGSNRRVSGWRASPGSGLAGGARLAQRGAAAALRHGGGGDGPNRGARTPRKSHGTFIGLESIRFRRMPNSQNMRKPNMVFSVNIYTEVGQPKLTPTQTRALKPQARHRDCPPIKQAGEETNTTRKSDQRSHDWRGQRSMQPSANKGQIVAAVHGEGP